MEMNKTDLRNRMLAALKTATGANFAMSFAMPVCRNGMVLDAAFLYATGVPSNMRTRPFAMIVYDPASGTLLKYQNAYLDDFMGEGRSMAEKVDYSVPGAVSAREQGELVRKVNALYEEVRGFALKETLSAEETEKLGAYKESFFKAVPAGLLPYYEALSPDFYAKLK